MFLKKSLMLTEVAFIEYNKNSNIVKNVYNLK